MADDTATLLDVLRDEVGVRSVKDGCSPQGQCGCCTVWVDGEPRVACVTPIRRLAGRQVTTLDGLPAGERDRWADALVATGGSQCGFCTPGIVMRLAALAGTAATTEQIDRSLLAHLCRCTGWQSIEEAARLALDPPSPDRPSSDRPSPAAPGGSAPRRLDRAAARATLEGGGPQQVGAEVVLGRAGFADDTSPAGCLVAVPDGSGGYVVADSVAEARARTGRAQGRSTTLALDHPVPVPEGAWALTLRTTWVEPGYVEPDASWCEPGGEPASPLANGGAFGGKRHSPVAEVARRLADQHQRPVRVLWSREDVVRHGPKRPPVAAGIDGDGHGVLAVGVSPGGVPADRWEAVVAAVAAVAPGLVLEQVPVVGPPISLDLRAAVWAEAAVLAAAGAAVASEGGPEPLVEVTAPGGGRASARCRGDDSIEVSVDAGAVLDQVVLRSYCIGAAHQAVGWVRTEGIAVDPSGTIHDLTMRSFGILRARDMAPVSVAVRSEAPGPSVNGSDAVFAAVAAARWLADGLPPEWPSHRAHEMARSMP